MQSSMSPQRLCPMPPVGSTACSAPGSTPSPAAPVRSSATSSASACWGYRKADRVQVPSPLVGEGQGEGACGYTTTVTGPHPNPLPLTQERVRSGELPSECWYSGSRTYADQFTHHDHHRGDSRYQLCILESPVV